MKSKDFGFLFWLHLILIVIAYGSPIWLDWRIITAGVVLLKSYYFYRGGCDITYWELGKDSDVTFVWYYLHKVFPRIDKKKTKHYMSTVLPIAIVLLGCGLQVLAGYKPLISF